MNSAVDCRSADRHPKPIAAKLMLPSYEFRIILILNISQALIRISSKVFKVGGRPERSITFSQAGIDVPRKESGTVRPEQSSMKADPFRGR